MKAKYTKRQILESIKYWERKLQHMDESLRVSLADKQSATKALLDHNDELTAFIEQKPHPSRDELIQFVADIFKEEGLDTPWTRQFLIKLKMYTHGWDDIVQYLWNARLKGIKLGMDQGKHPWANEEEEDFQPKTYFVQLFKSDEKGNIDKFFDLASQPDGELKYLADIYGLDRTFNTKAEAVRKAKTASRQQALEFLNDDTLLDDEAHCLAVVRQGDDWGSTVVACFIDGVLSPVASISKQLSDIEQLNEKDGYSIDTIDELIASLEFARDSIGGDAPVKIRSFNGRSPIYDDISKVEIQGNFAYIA